MGDELLRFNAACIRMCGVGPGGGGLLVGPGLLTFWSVGGFFGCRGAQDLRGNLSISQVCFVCTDNSK